MSNRSVSEVSIVLRIARDEILAFEPLVGMVCMGLVFFDETRETLFGREAAESMASLLSLNPTEPFRSFGFTFLTYPLAHVGWSHVLGSVFVWSWLGRMLRRRLAVRPLRRFVLAGYVVATTLIAFSFACGFAPSSDSGDRVLGLSGLVLFQLGLIVVLRPTFVVWILASSIFVVYAWGPRISSIANWGHGVGLLIGLLIGFAWRSWLSRAGGAFASRLSNRR